MYEDIKQALNERDLFCKHLDIKITEITETSASAIMPFDDRHKNANHALHGGASFAIADFTFGALASSHKVVTPTLMASILFLASAVQGPITATAQIISDSKHILVLESKVYDGTKKLVASYTATGYKTGHPMDI